MKLRCLPKRPLRCWQYSPSAEEVPIWVLAFIVYEGKNLHMRTGDEDVDVRKLPVVAQGDWLVEFPEATQVVLLTAREFDEFYEVLPQAKKDLS